MFHSQREGYSTLERYAYTLNTSFKQTVYKTRSSTCHMLVMYINDTNFLSCASTKPNTKQKYLYHIFFLSTYMREREQE